MSELAAETTNRRGDLLAAAIAAHEREDAAEVAAWTPEMHAYAAVLTEQIDFAPRLREVGRALDVPEPASRPRRVPVRRAA